MLNDEPDAPKAADRRIVRPRPGGRAPRTPALAAAPAAAPAAASQDGLQTLAGGKMGSVPSLLGPAMPLLQLIARLRTMASQPDPTDLRARTEAELAGFERRAEQAGVPADQVRRAHYALCASLDDQVLNTPWGAKGAWADRPLVTAFHPAVPAGRFFDVLRQAQDKVVTQRAVLELMFACVCLGYGGRGLPADIESHRAAAAACLAQHAPPVHAELAPAWRGVDAPFVPRRTRLPVWVAASVGAALVAGLFLALSVAVNDKSDALFARMLDAPPSHMPVVTRAPLPPSPPATEPSAQDRLRERLQAAIAAGRMAIAGTPASPVLRIPAKLLFATGSAALSADAAPLLQAAAEAFKPEAGRLRVVGYTDNRPIHTVQFPSAFQLSAAQAQAVRDGLARALADPARVAAEGRASADPIAANATPDGREQNRRIEIGLEAARS